MASIDFDLKQFLPESLQDSPFATDLSDAFQTVVADKVMKSVNTLLRSREASRDTKGKTIVSTTASVTYVIPDHFYRESLKLFISGNELVMESPATVNNVVADLINVQTGLKKGELNTETRTITLTTASASTSNPITIEVIYLTEYELDFEAISRLRKSLGMYMDATGLQDESIARRSVTDLPYFYSVGHSNRFVDYLSFVTGVRFDLEQLFCRLNEYPGYGTKLSETEMLAAGFGEWAHDATLPADPNDFNTVADDIWYKTSYVRLEYDDETFFNDVGFHVNLFEKITQLFYQLAPIQLVLETIVARRTREYSFRFRAAIRVTNAIIIETDPSSTTGIVIT